MVVLHVFNVLMDIISIPHPIIVVSHVNLLIPIAKYVHLFGIVQHAKSSIILILMECVLCVLRNIPSVGSVGLMVA